jgi:hypothetical protein
MCVVESAATYYGPLPTSTVSVTARWLVSITDNGGAAVIGDENAVRIGIDCRRDGLTPNFDRRDDGPIVEIEDRHRIIVRVGDERGMGRRVHRDVARPTPDGDGLDDRRLRGIDDRDCAVAPVGHVEEVAHRIGAHLGRRVADLDRRGDRPGYGVDHRDRTVSHIRDIDSAGRRIHLDTLRIVADRDRPGNGA